MRFLCSVLLATALGASMSTQAQELGVIRADATTIELQQRYTYNSALKAYELQQTQSRTVGEMTGTGAFHSVKSPINKTDTRVVGIQIKGYQRISVVEKNGKIFIRHMVSVDDTVDGLRMQMNYDIEVEAQFIASTLADYKAGKRVELAMTAEGRKTWLEQGAKSAGESIRAALAASLPGVKISTRTVSTEVSTMARYILDADQVQTIIPSYRLVVELAISR